MSKTKKRDRLSLEELEASLREEFGEDFITTADKVEDVARIPTGLVGMDRTLGGGIPRGRITEIYGPSSSSKTTLCLGIIAQAQKLGGNCVFIDAEKTFDKGWAELNGVDLKTLKLIEPTHGDQAWNVIESFIATNEVDVLVLDSIANCIPRAELDGNIGDANIGLHARLNSQAMRTVTSYFGAGENKNHRTALILINQERKAVSTGPASYGGPQNTTTGGTAIPYYATLRLELRRMSWVTRGGEDNVVGAQMRMRPIKAKITGVKPRASCLFEIDFDRGLDTAKDVLIGGIAMGFIKKKGAWFEIEGVEKPLQGEAAVKDYLRDSGLLNDFRERLLNA
jgi:recombination protein RecA